MSYVLGGRNYAYYGHIIHNATAFPVRAALINCFLKSYFRSVHLERLYSCWGHYWFCKMLAGVWRSCTRRWFCFRSYCAEMSLQFLCYSTDSFTLPQAKNERLLVHYRLWELFFNETKRFNKRRLPLLLWIVKFKNITNVVQAAYQFEQFFSDQSWRLFLQYYQVILWCFSDSSS